MSRMRMYGVFLGVVGVVFSHLLKWEFGELCVPAHVCRYVGLCAVVAATFTPEMPE